MYKSEKRNGIQIERSMISPQEVESMVCLVALAL